MMSERSVIVGPAANDEKLTVNVLFTNACFVPVAIIKFSFLHVSGLVHIETSMPSLVHVICWVIACTMMICIMPQCFVNWLKCNIVY